ncbi:esterase/lipase [Flammeovirgaceae bacterium 311]|nr:esterase/lipase [Flammeovirgaceae bacterium 311]
MEAHQFRIADTLLTEIKPAVPSNQLLIFCHGGAFVYGPIQLHWDAARRIVAQLGCTLWMVDYPKAPEHHIGKISHNIDLVYAKALEQYSADKIVLLGDSVGGTLMTGLTQRLVQKNIALPSKLVLISPVMDANVANPEIREVEKTDPMLSRNGVLSAKKMCAQHFGLADPRISPIRGSFTDFPATILLMAENDITYPDQKIAMQQMLDAKVDLKVVFGKEMPHIWPILPVIAEGKAAFNEMIYEIKKTSRSTVKRL